ncbi:unnamed protein product [Cuscuta campestris]|uniref:Uncharacterized protein n=1 Tax=Cuscuta campestris TaxID=132261 RepID=A0A484LQR6_9ASTE|nr:unnamed protein product [Cuscuta campestris]
MIKDRAAKPLPITAELEIGHQKGLCPLDHTQKVEQNPKPQMMKTNAWQVVSRKKGKDKKPARVWKVKDRHLSMQMVPWCEGLGETSRKGDQQSEGPPHDGTFVIDSNLLAAFNMAHLHGSLSPSSLVVVDPPVEVSDDSLAIVPFVESLALPEDVATEVGYFADGSSIDEVYRALSSPEGSQSPCPDKVSSSKISKAQVLRALVWISLLGLVNGGGGECIEGLTESF